MRLQHVPSYRIGKEIEIDAEKVFLATALTCHLIRHRIPWKMVHESAKDFRICDYYDKRSGQAGYDQGFYENSIKIMNGLMESLVFPHQENYPTGWSLDEFQQIGRFLDENENSPANAGSKKQLREKIYAKRSQRLKYFRTIGNQIYGCGFRHLVSVRRPIYSRRIFSLRLAGSV